MAELAIRVDPKDAHKYRLVHEVAALCDRKVETVKQWIRAGEIDGPSHYLELAGGGYAWLYTPEDTLRFMEFAKTKKPGRKKRSHSQT